MIRFELKQPGMTQASLGFLPGFFSEADPRAAKDQIETAYAHGGGWNPFGEGRWTMAPDGTLHYPEDPPFRMLAEAKLHDEIIRFYDCSFVAVVQPDGSFAVTRMD